MGRDIYQLIAGVGIGLAIYIVSFLVQKWGPPKLPFQIPSWVAALCCKPYGTNVVDAHVVGFQITGAVLIAVTLLSNLLRLDFDAKSRLIIITMIGGLLLCWAIVEIASRKRKR
jgi:hypothetical protein